MKGEGNCTAIEWKWLMGPLPWPSSELKEMPASMYLQAFSTALGTSFSRWRWSERAMPHAIAAARRISRMKSKSCT